MTARRIILFFAFSLLCWIGISAQDIKTHESRKAQLEKDIAIIDAQLEDNARKSRNELVQLNLIREKISGRKALIAENDRQIRKYSDDIYRTQKQINRLNERVDTLSAHYTRLVRSAYKNRDAKIWYMYILASDNLGQAFRRYSYFKNLSGQMRIQADEIRKAQSELAEEKKKLEALKSDAQKVRSRRVAELGLLKNEEKQSSQVVAKLKQNRTRYEKELALKKREVDALNREIERLISEAMSSKDKPSGGKKPQVIDYKLEAEFSGNKGKLPWPADGPVVERFGQNYHPVFTRVKLPFNNGISIALRKGTQVRAVFDGVVKQIVVMPGYNQCVLIQHGSYFSFYCKLQSSVVKPGDKVKTGQVIGTVDTINGETQLHFQVWQKQTPQNPELWLRKR